MASQDWLEKDFYKVLGVDKDVSDKELTKKYHKLAHKYHPDSNPGDAAAEAKFKDISEAYSVLSDKQQRQEYDQIRAMGAGGARFSQGAGGFEDIFGGMFGGGARRGAPNGSTSYEDLFNMFGGGGGGGFGFAPTPGRDIAANTTVSFRSAVAGDTITLNTQHGQIKVRIPAGIADGKKIKVRGKGEPSPNGGPAGNLVLTVKVRPHPVWERDGKNLRVKVPITFTEAVFGATIEVPTLDGETVKLKIAPHTPSGRVLRVKGRGIAADGGTGDLLAEVQVVVPSHLSDEQEQALAAFREVEPKENPRDDLLARAKA
ncbi:DnaJ C-terminal domain-containing protein [Canibacter zhoujuaniae]|uniref:DnaJ C-terminal domain-containing protein n=1 Tax=Canibacter zhoujuaniae TaxID=2708343 RepID=UPI0014243A2A|nr:DnaJ C-terminal domain-containing protein [Canibacter zhoujuaniae]